MQLGSCWDQVGIAGPCGMTCQFDAQRGSSVEMERVTHPMGAKHSRTDSI